MLKRRKFLVNSDSTSFLNQDVRTDVKVKALTDREQTLSFDTVMVENFKFVDVMSAGDVCKTKIVQLSKETQ